MSYKGFVQIITVIHSVEFYQRRVRILCTRRIKRCSSDIAHRRPDQRCIMSGPVLIAIHPVFFLIVPLINSCGCRTVVIPCHTFPDICILAVHRLPAATIRPYVVRRHRSLRRSYSGNLFQFMGPFQRDIISICQRPAGFRIDDVLLTGFSAYCIDPVKYSLLVTNVFSGKPHHHTAI